MAGLSLQCRDCRALLKSVEEAQEHAELTSHINFADSTEAVLNLLCTACGKPCRSKNETDLHTKRTGHTDFADKTAEATKPIELEAPKAAAAAAKDVDTPAGDCVTSGQPQEMVVPDVDKSLLEQLESIGFPLARATKVLHYPALLKEANTLHVAAIMLKGGRDWYWFNLSASDYSLVTQDDLLHMFSYLPRGLNFIDHTSNIGFQRAKSGLIDSGLYLKKKQDVFWILQQRSLPTGFKLFTCR